MRDIVATAAKWSFYVLALAIWFFTASLTVGLMGRLFPGSNFMPFIGLALFDVGMVVWLLVFLYYAAGIPQRVISLGLMIFDFLGVCLIAFGELFLGGQTLATIPAYVGELMIWVVIISSMVNAGAVLAFHIGNPAEIAEIRIRSIQDKIQSQALDQVEAQAAENAYTLAQQIKISGYAELLARLRLPSATAAPVIDVTAVDAQNTDTGNPAPAQVYAAEVSAPEVASIGSENPTSPAKRRRSVN